MRCLFIADGTSLIISGAGCSDCAKISNTVSSCETSLLSISLAILMNRGRVYSNASLGEQGEQSAPLTHFSNLRYGFPVCMICGYAIPTVSSQKTIREICWRGLTRYPTRRTRCSFRFMLSLQIRYEFRLNIEPRKAANVVVI